MLGDSAEQKVTKCHVLREVENLYLYGCKVNRERILMGLINNRTYCIIILQGKNSSFQNETNLQVILRPRVSFPTRKGADMDKFNISLLLIFMILFVLKNGSHCNK